MTDPANDANGINSQLLNVPAAPHSTPTPVGSQAYADVLSVLWENTTVKGKPGFKVTTTLSAAPTPPAGTVLVYRMLGTPTDCGFFGVVYYTAPGSQKDQPQSAVRDNCIDATTRLTAIDLPVIKESTITWTVPLSAIPADTKIKAGSTISDLRFEVVEIEDFRGQCIPADGVVYDTPTCGLGVGKLDMGVSSNSFKL